MPPEDALTNSNTIRDGISLRMRTRTAESRPRPDIRQRPAHRLDLAQGLNRSRGRGGQRAARAGVRTTIKPDPVSRSWGSTPCETGAFDVQEARQPAASALDRRHDGAPVQRRHEERLRSQCEEVRSLPRPVAGYGDER